MEHERLSYADTIAKRDAVAARMLDYLGDRSVGEWEGGEREHVDRLQRRQHERLVADTVYYEERAARHEQIGPGPEQ